jgi:hypothetical protein
MPAYTKYINQQKKELKKLRSFKSKEIDRKEQLKHFIECHKHSKNCKCFDNIPGSRTCGLDGCDLPKKPKFSKKYFAGGVIGSGQCPPGASCNGGNGMNGMGICQNCPSV